MEYVIALKFETRFLLKGISVASIAVLFPIDALRKFSFRLFNTLSVKTRHALFLMSKSSTNVATFMNLVACFKHKIDAFFLLAHVIKCRFKSKVSFAHFLITEATNCVTDLIRMCARTLPSLLALIRLHDLFSTSKSRK